eukprot:jgi/Chrpa1/3466/Chrysochromulina_OHIO_Genome00008160-RA
MELDALAARLGLALGEVGREIFLDLAHLTGGGGGARDGARSARVQQLDPAGLLALRGADERCVERIHGRWLVSGRLELAPRIGECELIGGHEAAVRAIKGWEDGRGQARVHDASMRERHWLEILLGDVSNITWATEVLDAVGEVGEHLVKGLLGAARQVLHAVPRGDIHRGPPVPADHDGAEAEDLVSQNFADLVVDASPVGLVHAALDRLLALAVQLAERAEGLERAVQGRFPRGTVKREWRTAGAIVERHIAR